MLFSIISVIFFNLIAILIPKQLTKHEIYTTSLFAFAMSSTTDLLLADKYHLYSYFDKGVQYMDIVTMVGIYPAMNTIFLNLFPFNKKLVVKIFYIVGWTIFAIAYEWIAEKTAFFNYTGWKLWYSSLIYPFLYMILLINLKATRWLQANTITPKDKS
jgi:hypothetical protein